MQTAFPRFSVLIALLAFAAVAAGAGSVLAGAWTQAQGKGQVLAVTTVTKSTHGFDDAGNAVRIPVYDKLEANLLVEYGVTDWLTVMFLPQLRATEIAAPTNADSFGLGYTDVGARARLWSDKTSVFSAQALARLPGSHDETNPADLGSTDPEFDIRVLYGHGFTVDGANAFVDAQLGYRVRFDDPSNEVRLDFSIGIRPTPKLLLLAQSFNTISDGSSQGIFEDGREHKIQLSAVWDFDDAWSVQLGGIGTLAGEDSLRERGIVFGVWRRF